MVGTGVYTSLGFQLQDLHSGFSILCLWGAGGIISLCGALSYAEIAARIPLSGGEYTYLSRIYHPALGFMAACVSLIAGFAAPIALSSMAFGCYLHAALPSCPPLISAMVAVVLISTGHLRSIERSSLLQNGMTVLKFLLAGLFVAAGAADALRHPEHLLALRLGEGTVRELMKPSSGIALLFVLYAYSGWNATTYLAEEVKNPRRTVGLSLVAGTLAVMLFYLLLNAVFLTSSPAAELRGVLQVGSVSASHLLGAAGGRIMSVIIALGLLASISAMIWAGPRVTQRVGVDYPVLSPLAITRNGIPHRALLLQLLLVLALIGLDSFETVLVFAQIPLLLCLMLGVIGLGVLRRKPSSLTNGDHGPSFRCPLYPLPPLLFLIPTIAGLVYSAVTRPWTALAGILLMLLPILLHRWIPSCRLS